MIFLKSEIKVSSFLLHSAAFWIALQWSLVAESVVVWPEFMGQVFACCLTGVCLQKTWLYFLCIEAFLHQISVF
jgi:hypothetical protein